MFRRAMSGPVEAADLEQSHCPIDRTFDAVHSTGKYHVL
jgi:hypothetical protein